MSVLTHNERIDLFDSFGADPDTTSISFAMGRKGLTRQQRKDLQARINKSKAIEAALSRFDKADLHGVDRDDAPYKVYGGWWMWLGLFWRYRSVIWAAVEYLVANYFTRKQNA